MFAFCNNILRIYFHYVIETEYLYISILNQGDIFLQINFAKLRNDLSVALWVVFFRNVNINFLFRIFHFFFVQIWYVTRLSDEVVLFIFSIIKYSKIWNNLELNSAKLQSTNLFDDENMLLETIFILITNLHFEGNFISKTIFIWKYFY